MSPDDTVQETRNTLLTEMGIQRIVLVDDELEPLEPRRFSESLCDIPEESLKESPHLEQFVVGASTAAARRTQVGEIYDDLEPEDKIEACARLNTLRPEVGEFAKTFRDHFGELPPGVDFREITPSMWAEDTNSFLADAEQTLFIFDLNQSKAGLADDQGARQAATLRKEAAGSYCAILSQEFTGNTEDDVKRLDELAEQHGIDGSSLIPVSKTTLRKDHRELSRRIKWVLLIDTYVDLKAAAREELQRAVDYASEELDQLGPLEFEQVVIRSSLEEGEWPPSTLFRVARIHMDERLLKSTVDGELHDLSNRLTAVADAVDLHPQDGYQKVRELERLDLYTEGEILAAVNAPIAVGDIFERVSNGRLYILLAQPCDLHVRNDGKRGRISRGFLCEIREPNKEAAQDQALGTSPPVISQFRLPVYTEDFEDRAISFLHAHSESFSVLDTCVFSDDGVGRLDLSDPPPEGLVPRWRAHYDRLVDRAESELKTFHRLTETFSEFRELKAARQESVDLERFERKVEKRFMPLAGDGGTKFLPKKDPDEGVIEFDVRRVGRLRTDWSRVALELLYRFQSRDAFEHPLTKGLPEMTDAEDEPL